MALYKVEICGVNTAKLPLLTNEEKDMLFARIKQGDKSAREEYIRGNLRLVLSIIQRFSGNNENVDDLFQIGCIGLMKAIDNFDITQGVKFSTYAVPMIIGEIRRHLRDHHALRVSRSLRDIAYKAMQAKERYITEHLREPTIEQLAQAIEMKKEDVLFALDAIQDPMSLNEPIYSDGGDAIYMMDQIKDKVTEEQWVGTISLQESMKRLNSRQKMIIEKRFFLGETQTEIAQSLGISQAQISRLEKSAVELLKRDFR